MMKNIVVLVSGGGTNLQRIIDTIKTGEISNAQITKVIADRNCFALERAGKNDIPATLISRGENFSTELQNSIPADTDLIVLAGFLSFISQELCKKFVGKIINIHPALLPKFGGKGMWGHHVHQAVLAANEVESGATVHFVTPGIDEGEIILQQSFPLSSNETLETLEKKVHHIEQIILPEAINRVLKIVN